MAQNLPHLPDWEQVSTNIIRILGGNPSKFTLQGTNTYLLGTGPQRILIDTAAGERKWIDTVRTVLTSTSQTPLTVSTCLLTHWHGDHLGGVTDLEQLHADLPPSSKPPPQFYKNLPTYDPESLLTTSTIHDIHDGQTFSIPNPDSTSPTFEITAIHTPGHAKDHIVFQITSSPDASEIGALFTADNVLGHGTAVFEDLALYLSSLHTMKRHVLDIASASGATKRAYPGHGAVIEDITAKIDEYILHRKMREDEALNVLRYGTVKPPHGSVAAKLDTLTTTGDSDTETESSPDVAPKIVAGREWTSMEMVRVIYRHYPENLWEPAERGLLMVLEKLRGEGKVVHLVGDEGGKGRWRVSEKATL